jgi:hypothetical protein
VGGEWENGERVGLGEEAEPGASLLVDVALHYAAAVTEGRFGVILRSDRVGGTPVVPMPGGAVGERPSGALDELVGGSGVLLASKVRNTTLPCERSHGDSVADSPADTFATLDAVVVGDGWFAAGRLAWLLPDLDETQVSRCHEALILAVAEPNRDPGVGVYRYAGDTAGGAAPLRLVKDALVREVVLRPVFERSLSRLYGLVR